MRLSRKKLEVSMSELNTILKENMKIDYHKGEVKPYSVYRVIRGERYNTRIAPLEARFTANELYYLILGAWAVSTHY